jgi:hypothetical protein
MGADPKPLSPFVKDWESASGYRYETLVNRPCRVFQ